MTIAIYGAVLKDSESGVRTILKLGHHATIVRVSMLREQSPRPVAVGRSAIAQYFVEQVDDASWAGQASFAGVQ